MKKVTLLILISILLLFAFTSCSKLKIFNRKNQDEPKVDVGVNNPDQNNECAHEWTEATCTVAKTCKACGVTEGSPLKHQTAAPTCTTPEMCKVCGFTSDYWRPALGHNWVEANCLTGRAKYCRTCSITEGDVPEHQWSEASCFDDSYCTVCNLVNKGTALGHEFVPTDPVAPTCTESGKTVGSACCRCELVEEGKEPQTVPALEHKGYEVEIEGTPATCDTPGLTPGKKCELCGTVTDPQLTLDPKGHQRYTYDEEGNVTADGYLRTEYPVNPDTGLPYAACESEGVTVYKCFVCEEEVEIAEPQVHHLYPDGATCSDLDAVCAYCSKSIEHEYADPTCYVAATCIICGEVQEGSEPLEHKMVDATCIAPKNCEHCGLTEGEKLPHVLSFEVKSGEPLYSCNNCGSAFVPQDEVYYIDGSNHNYMVPVNNGSAGYDTHKDADGTATHFPKIETDATGNKYLSLIKTREPDTNASGEAYPPQAQLWIPLQRGGFSGFSSLNAAVGFLSFRFNGLMDKNFSVTFVEGGGWGAEDVVKDFFVLTPPTTNDETGETKVQLLALDDGDKETPQMVLFEKDITGATSASDKFTGWIDVYVGIVLDDATDTINLHYYIDGIYKGTITSPLTTSGNGIKCIYLSGNTNEIGSGIMVDDIAFGYTAVGNWPFDTNHEHSYTVVADALDPTCTTDGYVIYSCACGDIGNRVTMPALGHLEHHVEAAVADCTNDGHNAYAYCAREDCGIELIKKEVYPATGHNYKTTADREATCTRPGALYQTCNTCGFINQETRPALGHEYPLTDDCTLGGVCVRCSYVSSLPIGHAFAPATCTEPATCMREGCGATDGDPLGHELSAPTCTVPATCTRCATTEGYKLSHTVAHKVVKSVLHYYCTECNTTYQIGTGYFLNGTNHKDMVAATGVTNSTNFTVATGTELPNIVDGHYEFINKTGANGQLQVWVPVDDNTNNFGFSADNRAVGVFSFKMNAYVDEANSISFKFVDGLSNNGSDRWNPAGTIGEIVINGLADGVIKLGYKHSGENAQIEIYSFTVDANKFTGWSDVMVGMELNPDADQVTYHFYINGEYITSFSKTLTTKTNSINCVYISGYTTALGSGIMLDDIAFGYTANGEWVLDTCHHNYTTETVDPTCTAEGYTKSSCSECGHILITDKIPAFGHTELEAPTCTNGSLCETCGEYYGEALGHTGGKATCTEQAVCDRCGEPYGLPAHDIVDATCSAGAYCKACGEIFGEKVSHNPVVKLEDKTVTYFCKYCEKSYVLSNAYYHDGQTSVGNMVPLAEDPSYSFSADDGNYKLTLESAPTGNGKAWVWVPTNASGVTDFEGFKNGAVGVLSFSLDIYTSKSFQVHLIDSDYRSGGPAGSFWENYTMQSVFSVTHPDKNVVSLKAWDGTVLSTINVTDENKYTGEFDVTIGIELTGGKIIFHYYINGAYVTSVIDTFKVASGKIDGATFLCESGVVGSGFAVDNIVFGYAVPYGDNPAPVKPE